MDGGAPRKRLKVIYGDTRVAFSVAADASVEDACVDAQRALTEWGAAPVGRKVETLALPDQIRLCTRERIADVVQDELLVAIFEDPPASSHPAPIPSPPSPVSASLAAAGPPMQASSAAVFNLSATSSVVNLMALAEDAVELARLNSMLVQHIGAKGHQALAMAAKLPLAVKALAIGIKPHELIIDATSKHQFIGRAMGEDAMAFLEPVSVDAEPLSPHTCVRHLSSGEAHVGGLKPGDEEEADDDDDDDDEWTPDRARQRGKAVSSTTSEPLGLGGRQRKPARGRREAASDSRPQLHGCTSPFMLSESCSFMLSERQQLKRLGVSLDIEAGRRKGDRNSEHLREIQASSRSGIEEDGGNGEQVSGGAALEKQDQLDIFAFSSEAERRAFVQVCETEGHRGACGGDGGVDGGTSGATPDPREEEAEAEGKARGAGGSKSRSTYRCSVCGQPKRWVRVCLGGCARPLALLDCLLATCTC